MPISGLVLRLQPSVCRARLGEALSQHPGLSLGERSESAWAAVVEADDYLAHDTAIQQLVGTPGISSVDVVFHDFSDVTHFDHLPKRQRSTR